MTTFTGCSNTEVYDLIEAGLESGKSIVSVAHAFTQKQLAHFIDEYFTAIRPLKKTASTDRSISKSLCCFLYLLNDENRPMHYWRLIEKSPTGSGHWRIAERGKAFLNGELSIAYVLTIKNNTVVKASDRRVSIADFDGFNHVSYNEINFIGDITEIE